MELTVLLSDADAKEIIAIATLLRCTPGQLASVILTCPPMSEMLSDEANLRGIIEELSIRFPQKSESQ